MIRLAYYSMGVSQVSTAARQVSYKSVLLGRHNAALESREEPAPLNYIDLRNQEALRAWRRRCAGMPELLDQRRSRFSLTALFRSDVAWR
jgi:hypothetical protein